MFGSNTIPKYLEKKRSQRWKSKYVAQFRQLTFWRNTQEARIPAPLMTGLTDRIHFFCYLFILSRLISSSLSSLKSLEIISIIFHVILKSSGQSPHGHEGIIFSSSMSGHHNNYHHQNHHHHY